MQGQENARDVAGDLGRRVTSRRHDLGLSRKELADRTGIAVSYLAYVEQHPAAVTGETLERLANGLEISIDSLLGGQVHRPGGSRSTPGSSAIVRDLSSADCLRLIAPGGVGRLGFDAAGSPMILPVNFALHDGVVVVRTSVGSQVYALAGRTVAFEVDSLDRVTARAWSVVLIGTLRAITDPVLAARARRDIQPWIGAGRDAVLRLDPRRITGRHIDRDPDRNPSR